MSTDLATLVPALKRTLAVPGTFDTFFPDASNNDWRDTLADAFAEAQMDLVMPFAMTISTLAVVDTDLTAAQGAVVVLYAKARVISSELLNRKSLRKYEAAGTIFEEQQGVGLLVEQLKMLQATKAQIIANLRTAGGVEFTMLDAYLYRGIGFSPNGAGSVGWNGIHDFYPDMAW